MFKPSLPVKSLSAESQCHASQIDAQEYPSQNSANTSRLARQYPTTLSRSPSRLRPSDKVFEAKHKINPKRIPLEDITNLYQDASLDDADLLQARRIVSAPLPESRYHSITHEVDSRPPTPALTANSGTPSVSSLASLSERQDRGVTAALHHFPSERRLQVLASPREELKRVLSDPCTLPSRPHQRLSDDLPPRIFSGATTPTAVSQGRLTGSAPTSCSSGTKHRDGRPFEKTRAFNTGRLRADTHKVSRGQLVILPSKSVLVDFREGERRKGRSGKEVLVISPDGRRVSDARPE